MSGNNTVIKGREKFPIAGYLYLVGTALFTALSYVFGRAIDRSFHPAAITFYWFFGAFLCSVARRASDPVAEGRGQDAWENTRRYSYTAPY